MSRCQLGRHSNLVHGDEMECGVCRFELPSTRKYLMVQNIERKHLGKAIRYNVCRRDIFCHPYSPTISFPDCRKRIVPSRRSPRKAVPYSPRRDHHRVSSPRNHQTHKASTLPVPASHSPLQDSRSADQLPPLTVPDPITSLSSPSFSVSLESPMEMDPLGIPKTPVPGSAPKGHSLSMPS